MKSVATEGGGRPFITKWQWKRGEVLEIPIVGQYQLVIKDANGQEVINEEVKIVNEEHPYLFTPPADGLYTVEAGPEGVEYMRMYEEEEFEDEDDFEYDDDFEYADWMDEYRNEALREVVQFGTVKWRSMRRAFHRYTEMTFAPDIDTPDLSQVTDMSRMFAGCTAFNQPLGKWNVANVVNMDSMFLKCSAFNQPLGGWNVGKVTDMSWMFSGCSSFNQPLEKWNVGQVTDMREMFKNCRSFNQPLEKWDVGQVTDMSRMFLGCSAFNQSPAAWDISNLRKDAAKDLFTNCPAGALPFAQEWRKKGYKF